MSTVPPRLSRAGPHFPAGASVLPRALPRREFVTGLAAGGVTAGLGLWPRGAGAWSDLGRLPVLSGTEFELAIGETPVNFTGSVRTALTVNGSLPAPTLRWREGDTVTLRVVNTLAETTSIHWHGILLPANMDGVPGLSFDGIAPGETHVYRFTLKQAGTYWYHSHSGFQEQLGLYGAMIVEPREPEPFAYDRDQVVILSEWTDEDPDRVYARLKKLPHYYNRAQPTLGDFFRDWRRLGLGAAVSERAEWGAMRMNRSDIADVTGATYTFLMNGRTPDGNWTALFNPGERVRLRLVNAGAMTHFDFRIPGLPLTVVAADGVPIHPVTGEELRIAPGETFDVLVRPQGQDAFTLFAQPMDRSGYARGTLAARPGLAAAIPPTDLPPRLTMLDMPGHGGHDAPASGAPAAHGAPTSGGHAAHGAPTSGAHAAHAMPDPAGRSGGRLDDPGVGLRGNGRRVLTYADFRTLFPDPDGRAPGRTLQLNLTGNMERFSWSFDEVPYSEAAPIRLNYGERMRIVLVNDTMMAHPIHLHGMWSDLEDDDGAFKLRKHVVDMPPGTRRSFRVRADALGRWAFHCHMLYHMAAGMFREVRVMES